jgi:hypothetical protein
MTDKANETPESIGIRVARTHLLHARQINAVEESVNMHMGGDATVGELVSLMIVMGWKPPGDQAVAGAEPVTVQEAARVLLKWEAQQGAVFGACSGVVKVYRFNRVLESLAAVAQKGGE